MKRILTIMLMSAALLLHACKAERAENPARETVPLVSISLATKASDPEESDAQDGYAFRNVLVVLTDPSGKVVTPPKYKEYSGDYTDKDVIDFENVEIGEYTVYAYANIDNTAWQKGTVESVEKVLAKGDVLDADRLLATISDCTELADARFDGKKAMPGKPMLLTGSDRLSVSVASTSGTVHLLRPVCRLNVYVNNHSDAPVTLTDLWFSKFGASQSYLLDHRDANGLPSLPVGNSYIDLPTISSASIEVKGNGVDTLVYSTLLYENNAPVDYKIYGTVRRDGEEQHIHSIPEARLIPRSEIVGMAAGETKTVMLCNPSTNGGRFFGSTGTAITATPIKSVMTMKGFRDFARYHILNTRTEQGKYILILTKNDDNSYSLKHESSGYDIVNSNFSVEGGAVSDSYILSDFKDYVMKIKKNNGNYIFRNNGALGETTGSLDNHTRQWVFYEPLFVDGDVLKLVDNETSKVSPVTSMLRNQELNVILNVYYHDTPGSFNFYVDNAYWGEGHSIGHIFK